MSRTNLSFLLLIVLGAVIQRQTRGAETAGGKGFLIVANKADRTVGIVDPVAGRQVSAVPEGGVTAHEVAVSPDGRLVFAPIYGDSGVGQPGSDGSNMVVVDLGKRAVSGDLKFGRGLRPHCAVFGPRDGLLYVTTELDNSVTVVDPKTLKVVGAISTGQPESHMLAITKDGSRGYTANVGPGSVSVLDLRARKTIAVIPVAQHVQRIALSVDDALAFTSEAGRPAQGQPRLAVIDTASNKVRTFVSLPSASYGTAATPDGRWLIAALPAANQVAAIDLKAMKLARTIDVPRAPQEVLISPDGRTAYVSCDASGKVAAISLSDWKVEKLIDAGKGVDGLAWAQMP